MKRIPRWTIPAAVLVLLTAGVIVLALPDIVMPNADKAARAALDALHDAGTVTVHGLGPADGTDPVQVRGTVRRTTRGDDRVEADFDQLFLTGLHDDADLYRNVQARVVGPTTYTRNYIPMGGQTSWVELDTDGQDDLSLALALLDPVSILQAAEGLSKYTEETRRAGLVSQRYSVSCVGCDPSDLPGMSDPTAGADPTGTDVAAPTGPVELNMVIDWVLDARSRPTSIDLDVKAGEVDYTLALHLDQFGDPLSVTQPRGASPSPIPGNYG